MMKLPDFSLSPNVLTLFDRLDLEVITPTEDDYIPDEKDRVALFPPAMRKGKYWVTAHLSKAGHWFSELDIEDELTFIGHPYRVVRIDRFRALSPDSAFTQLHSLDGEVQWAGSRYAEWLVNSSYDLVLQTCITIDGRRRAGRLFVLCEEIDG